MATTTTNYGWDIPQSTDLVKDGATAIAALGQDIDTTTKALNPSTTLGDLEYRSATANTNTRLGIGSTGNVLTVAGGVPTWAAPSGDANLAQIATGTLSGTSVTISSLSSYKKLYLRILNGGTTSGNSNQLLRTRINNNSGSNYLQNGFIQQPADGARYSAFATKTAIIPQEDPMFSTGLGALFIEFDNCATTGFTTGQALRYYTASSQSDGQAVVSFIYTQAEAVSSLVLTLDGSATFNSGTYTVWGA